MTHVLDFQTLAPPASHEGGVLRSMISYHCGPGTSSLSTGICDTPSTLSLVLCP